jgi:predicted amidohydrolase YtcJ
LSRTRTLDEVLAVIGRRVAASQPGDVIVTNSDWHEAQLKEQRLPLRRDLDKVSANTPVVVVRGGHEYILNSAALAKWNLTDAAAKIASSICFVFGWPLASVGIFAGPGGAAVLTRGPSVMV